mgnify:CR=1 FL=1
MLKVLIAEDEPLSLQNLSGQMRDLLGADALIEGVANGREAVERARQIQPQLVLMDIEMPVMNGLDAAAIIHKAMPETHIVFLTAFDRFDYAVGAMRAGGTDYLVKPFAYERFRQALDVFCRRRESVQRDSFSQDVLDHTLFQAAAPTPPVTPPKGLQSQTLSRIEAYLRAAPETRHTSDEIASHVGLSVVTVRRYMNYLAEQQVIGSEMDYRTGGRPCLVYFLRK